MDSEMEESETSQWRVMSDHLFMPRKLSLIHCERAGHLLGRHLLLFMKNSDIQWLIPVAERFLQFVSHPPDAKQLIHSFQESNYLLAVPLIDHNAVVLFNNRIEESDASVLVSAFDILPHEKSLQSTSADACPFPSVCKLAIPRRSLTVPAEELTSQLFADQLAALGRKSEFPLREAKARKAGHEVTETRKPPVPTYVFDWLMNTLQWTTSAKNPEMFTKSIRLESVRRDKAEKPWTRSVTWVALKSLVHLCLVQLHGFHLGTEIYKRNMLHFQSSFVRHMLKLHQTGQCRRDFGELREMCAYLTRKASKLQRCHPSCSDILKEICQTCELVDQVLSAEWAEYLQSEKDKSRIDVESLAKLDFSSDTWNPLPNARPALREALGTDLILQDLLDRRQVPTLDQVLQVQLTAEMLSNPLTLMTKLIGNLEEWTSSEDVERALQLTEDCIRLHLWPLKVCSSENVLSAAHRLLVAYQQRCAERYKGDPVRLSKMILYCCTLVVWMDSVALQWDPLQLLADHQLLIIDTDELQALLLIDVVDVRLLQEVHDRILERTNQLSPGILDISHQGLAYAYASKDASMLTYERNYFDEVQRLTADKEKQLAEAKSKYHSLERKIALSVCTCYSNGEFSYKCRRWGRCADERDLKELETSVRIYERRLPDNQLQRRVVIFHHLMPSALVHLMESCALVASLCADDRSNWFNFDPHPYTWDEVDYSRRIAVGSDTKSFVNCHYGNSPSILTSSSNFVVPQGKGVQSIVKVGQKHKVVNGRFQWHLSRYCHLAIGSPFQQLEFAAHGTRHTENDVLAMQCDCPADLELISFQEFGTLRAGGYLQWRNLATAFEGSALDLNSPPVAMLLLQTAYQVGPLPVDQHWNFDLNEEPFVRLLCEHIASVVRRIEFNWSAHRTLFICISICKYVAQHALQELTGRALELLELCRRTAIHWSHSVETSISKDASQSVSDADKIRSLLYINALIILTHEADVSSLEQVFQLLRARTVMFERRHVTKDEELERIVSLCSRTVAKYEQRIHSLLLQFEHVPLSRVVTDRWPQCTASTWSRLADCHYQGVCTSSGSRMHFNIFDGTFLVDGEPIGRLPDRILSHHLFRSNFPSADVPALHRGGGVHQTTGLKDAVYTFALLADGALLVKEERNGRSSRLIESPVFHEDLPAPLVSGHSFWMTYNGPDRYVELRRRNMFQSGDFGPVYRIKFNRQLRGQLQHLESGRLLLNFRGDLFDRVFSSLVWRLDDRSHVIPYLPLPADTWSLCLHLHRLHQHIEIGQSVRIREFENMAVAADQFLGTFIGLEHKLVLERPNGLRTVIVPFVNFGTTLVGSHLKVVKDSAPDASIPFFSFDEDVSLKQMRPHGSETLASWLMCVYLHGITSSAMADPLTHLTGLEMAVTQLRRCYGNKPFDAICTAILAKIGHLSATRCFAYDTELVRWNKNRSAYSSSEVYRLLTQLIHRKSTHLQRLYGHDQAETKEDVALYQKAYRRYEWSCSSDGQLNEHEREQLDLVDPLVVADVQIVQADANIVRQFVHSPTCQTTLEHLMARQPSKFDWAQFFERKYLEPIAAVPVDVGAWSTYQFQSNWLSLCTEAVKLAQCPDAQRRQRFVHLLSFMAWSDDSLTAPAIALLEIVLSSFETDILTKFQPPPTKILMGPRRLSIDEIRGQLRSTCFYSDNEHADRSFNRNLPVVVERIKSLSIWKCSSDLCPSDVKAGDPFRNMWGGLEEFRYWFNVNSFIESMTEHYHQLFHREQIHLFGVAINSLVKDATASGTCAGSCPAPLPATVVKIAAGIPMESNKKPIHLPESNVVKGKCEILERQFLSCLSTKPAECGISDFPLNFPNPADDELIASELVAKLRNSWTLFHQSKVENGTTYVDGDVESIRTKLRCIQQEAGQLARDSWRRLQLLEQPDEAEWLERCRQAAGLVSLAPRSLFQRFGRSGSLSTEVRSVLSQHLVYLVYEQKAIRCLEMVDVWQATPVEQRQLYSQRLTREIMEPHCEDWSPEERPKWLLFEVECNVLIRRIQAQVALKIIAGEEQILQLNMGEGKTSVISPLVCSSLADGSHVVQLTLLTSLLESHGQELALKLSGLLEQPVYYFPCRRDVHFDEELIRRMVDSLKECVRLGGCIVTVPEQRMSLLLKMEELSIQKGPSPEVDAFLELFHVQRTHLIDLIDESDEILRHKFQLLYTMGSQTAIDGGERRWKVLQDILLVLLPQEESDAICAQIARLELNKEGGEEQLVKRMLDDLFNGRVASLAYFAMLNAQLKEQLWNYLNDLECDWNQVKSQLTDLQVQDVLIVRGLLTYGVLPHSLKRRWSVDYGVDGVTKRRLMAVPFRGKDTPMPRTEFGHPDVSLVLTHLSYYHTGLNEQQVADALVKLKQLPQRETVYQQWAKMAAPPVPTDVNSINFDDLEQLQVLSGFLRFNRLCIHFWLSCCVLPKETRQFPFKLMATSWDLAREQSQPLRGFSGTKDSSYLLPVNVRLGSLPQLDGTDGDVLWRIADPPNRKVHNLSADGAEVAAKSVVDFIVRCGKGNILIDCGALMVGMTNRQVAEYWLSQAPSKFMAAAYFEQDNVLLLLRNGHQSPLHYSPLKGRLANVLIYMDDVHTRGTDFKLPIPSHGYVTVGRNLPKDKLVQACMRMRQLGHGHSISFLCPHEVYAQLQKVSHPALPESPHVIQWALHNTISQIRNGLIEWASQGLHFSRRVTATKVMQSQLHLADSQRFEYFTHLVQIPEMLSLSQMYEAVQGSSLAAQVLDDNRIRHLRNLSSAFRRIAGPECEEAELLRDAEDIASALVHHCKKYLGRTELKSKSLDEQQEKELEEEEERQIDRPGRQSPHKPLHPKWIVSLQRCQTVKELKPLWCSMERTTAKDLLSAQCFDPRILVTGNYCQTLKDEIAIQDEFVRPPRWLLAVWQRSGSVQHLILVSPFEANILVAHLRRSQLKNASLHRFAPRTRRDQGELLTSALTVWSGGEPLVSPDMLPDCLEFGVMAMTLFGCSTCLQSDQTFQRSMAQFCHFVNIVPPPDACRIGFDTSDWNTLLERGCIDSEGFICRPSDGGLSEDGEQLLRRILTARHWQRSPASAIRALVSMRNMAAFFQSSDMALILFSQ